MGDLTEKKYYVFSEMKSNNYDEWFFYFVFHTHTQDTNLNCIVQNRNRNIVSLMKDEAQFETITLELTCVAIIPFIMVY